MHKLHAVSASAIRWLPCWRTGRARWGKEWAEAAQVGILDQENRLVPVGKIGEVCIRGPNVTKGYLNNPSANKEAYAGEH
jgi:acyl-CoA synthetase (AMP-forming)/AMP-acid ligase II